MRRRILLPVAPVALGVAAVVAVAAWATLGSGRPSVAAATMPTGSTPSASAAGRDVTASWSQDTLSNGVAVSGYTVKRYPAAGGSAVSVGSNCNGTVSALTCTELAVTPGSWKYTVTPVMRSWHGTESAQSSAVVVASPAMTLGAAAVRPSQTVSAAVSNFIDGESVTFHLGSAAGTTIGGPVTVSSAAGSNGTANATLTIPAGTANGSYTVYAVASPSGDQATAPLLVDGTAPTVSGMALAPVGNTTTQGYIAQGGSYYVYANASDTGGSGLSSVTANVSNLTSAATSVSLVAGSYSAFGTTWSYRSAAQTANATLAAGSKGYTVTASDGAGNTGSSSSSVTVDNTLPVISDTALAPTSNTTTAGYVAQGVSYYVYANASDSGASGLATVTANVNAITTGQTAVSLVAGTYSAFGKTYTYRSAALVAKSGLSAGSQGWSVTATSNAADVATASTTVTVDNTTPTINGVALAHVSNTTSQGTLAQGVSYYAYANAAQSGASGLATVTADLSTISTGLSGAPLASGSYPAFGTTFTYRTAAETADSTLSGTRSYSVTATSNAGLSTAVAGSVTADTTSPTVSAVSSTNNNGTVDIGDTFVVTFSKSIDPGTVSTTAGASTLTFSLGTGASAHVMVSISGLMASSDTGLTSGWVKTNKSISYPGTLSLGNSNQTVTFTVTGACTGTNCGNNADTGAAGQLTYTPDTSSSSPYKLNDYAGNTVTGTRLYPSTGTIKLF